MSLEVERLDSVVAANRNQWNHVVEHADLGCLYHRYEWLRAIEQGTSYEPRHLLVTKDGNPIGMLPSVVTAAGPVKRLDSTYPGFGGPIALTDEEVVIRRLLEAVPRLCEGRIRLNRLSTFDEGYVRYHGLFAEYGYRLRLRWCRFSLDLTAGWEAILDEMDRARRRGIRRGNDQTFEIDGTAVTERRLSSFHDDYAVVMERGGLTPLPRSFFLELTRLADRLKLFTLRVNGTDCGAILVHLDDEQSTIHYAYSAVREEHYQHRAAEVLHAHAIRWGIRNGYDVYDFRRTDPDFRDGLFGFKEQFGARARPLLSWERGSPRIALSAVNLARHLEQRIG
ncbi:GNAT family N-acetyltransferase [Natronococcus wangiae]|uniref:GNAT family N-acetyltransferase n=1 Tax=Natronococcus wangiae TaxID=3068275 RepID=UPI00273E9EB7|nr:GNAT family N-acetyltransferase [Natronococcus sp. AD5]